MTEYPELPAGWDPTAAGEAARQRALSCRRRIEALRLGRPFDSEDARHAQESLEAARNRAAAAAGRCQIRAARLVAVQTADVYQHTLSEQPDGCIADRLREHGIAVSALFEQYFAIGGEASLFDVDGHVHGVIELPRAQRNVLEHALWELIELSAD